MKTPLTQEDKKFDLKFLLVGNSGTGKTHFAATYTQGPVHFYMLDPGGEKTLYKLLKDRPKESPLTVDRFSIRDNSYTDFWNQIIADEKAGFFQEMYEKNGLVVFPDSITAANDMAMKEVAKKNKRSLLDGKNPLRIQDWGQLGQWMKQLVETANALPCAVAALAHLHTDTNDEGAVTGRYPAISGQFRSKMGIYFDEIYLLENIGTKRMIHFQEKSKFQAKSRTFAPKSITDTSLNTLATAYLTGDTLEGAK